MFQSIPRARIAALTAALALSVGALAACGDDGDETTTTSEERVDATAFKDCILSGNIERGVYEEIPEGASVLVDAATETGAEMFEAGKADDGIVAFYVYADSGAAGDAIDTVQGAIDTLHASLAEQAKGGDQLGDPSVESEGSIAVALLPFSSGKEAELSDEVSADIADCLEEISA